MKKIFFATTNENKLKEAREVLGIEVEGSGLEIEEIQSLDPLKVATQKAKDYFKELKKPIFIEDVSLEFAGLKGLPGPYINDFLKTLGNEGLMALLKGKKDRKAIAQTTLVFIDKSGVHLFVGKVEGTITTKEKGTNGFGWDPIFVPKGEKKTFAEMDDATKNKYSMRAKALKKFEKWLKAND